MKPWESPDMLRLLAFPFLALASVPAGYLSAATARAEPGLYLVLAPPWRDADALIAAAGGRAVGPGMAPLGRFVSADEAGFPARAAHLGLLVLDGQTFTFLCRNDA